MNIDDISWNITGSNVYSDIDDTKDNIDNGNNVNYNLNLNELKTRNIHNMILILTAYCRRLCDL